MKKTILITGGSDGLGKAIAKELSFEHTVVILAQNKAGLETVAKELSCDYEVCDVTDDKAIEKAVASVIKKHGGIDCLINNAGVWIEGPLGANEPERIKKVLAVNTIGTILMTRAVLPQMKKQKSGRIINVISQAGLYAKKERSVYTASKWALTGFTKSLEPELAPFGIAVTGLYPGLMKTKLFEKTGVEKDFSEALSPEEAAKLAAFIVESSDTTVFPEMGIKFLGN